MESMSTESKTPPRSQSPPEQLISPTDPTQDELLQQAIQQQDDDGIPICALCRQECFENIFTTNPCGHEFHNDCMYGLFERTGEGHAAKCPMCRTVISFESKTTPPTAQPLELDVATTTKHTEQSMYDEAAINRRIRVIKYEGRKYKWTASAITGRCQTRASIQRKIDRLNLEVAALKRKKVELESLKARDEEMRALLDRLYANKQQRGVKRKRHTQ